MAEALPREHTQPREPPNRRIRGASETVQVCFDLRGAQPYPAHRLLKCDGHAVFEQERRKDDLAQVRHLRSLAGKAHGHCSAGRLRQCLAMFASDRLLQIVGELGRAPVRQRGEQWIRRNARTQLHVRFAVGP